MKHSEIVKAIQFIRPDAEFALTGDELTWLDKKQTQPTDAEIEAGFNAYELAAKAETKAKAAAKTAAEGKLAALGLTLDDLRALGL
jgi:hypothetical protein